MTSAQMLATPKARGSNSHGWTRANRRNPCPICNGTDNCTWTETHCYCGRVSEGSIPGRENAGAQYLHRMNDRFESTAFNRTRTHTHKRHPKKQAARPNVTPATSDIRRMNDPNNITHPESAQSRAIRERLSESIGVSVRSLEKIGVHYRNRDTVGIPERDFEGNVIGISTRCLSTGEKKFATGGNRGLTYCTDWDHDRWDGTGPIFVVEGASDVAAGIDLDLSVVGRPSNIMDADVGALVALCCAFTGREIIIVGERDQKPDGRFPGLDGAVAVAKKLSRQLPSDARITVALPPIGCKDLRSFRNKATAEECQSGAAAERFLAHLEFIDWERQDSLCDLQPKPKSKIDEWAYQSDLERELIDRRQSCAFRRAITDGKGTVLRLKLDCRTWSCPSCRKKNQSKWSKHFSTIIGQIEPDSEFHQHYSKLKTPETVFRFTVQDHTPDSKSRELSRIVAWLRRHDGNFVRLSTTEGRTTLYSSARPPKLQAESLTPADAAVRLEEDIQSELIRDRRPIHTSSKWQRPKPSPLEETEEKWEAVKGNWNSTVAIFRTGEEFGIPVFEPAKSIGHQKSDVDLKIIFPADHPNLNGLVKAFAERVTENAELRRNKEFGSHDDHVAAMNTTFGELEFTEECRRESNNGKAVRLTTTNDSFDPWIRPPDPRKTLGLRTQT